MSRPAQRQGAEHEGTSAQDFDLIVLGSGAAGLSAALFAAAQKRSVLLAEKSAWIGGTTAMSGGCIWIPCNHHMASIGASDSAQDALRYIRAVAPPGWAASEEQHWQAFVEAGPKMLRFVEAHSPLRLHVGGEPDPYLEAPGALRRGRNVSPRPFRFARLGAWAQRVRPSAMPYLLAYYEVTDTHLFARPSQAVTRFGAQLLWRLATGRRAMGQALVGGLLAGCVEQGCDVRTGLRAMELVQRDDGRVSGVRFENGEVHSARLTAWSSPPAASSGTRS